MRLTALLALVLTQACWATPPATSPTSVRIVPAAGGADYAPTIADPLGFLPASAEVILALDTAQLRTSALWQTFEPKLLAAAGPTVGTLQRACGADLLAGLQSITFGGSNLDVAPTGTMVIRGLDRTRTLACIAKDSRSRPGITFDGERLFYRTPDSSDVALQFVDHTTAIVIFGDTVGIEELGTVLRSGAPLRSAAVFADAFEAIDSQKTMWFIVSGAMAQLQLLATLGLGPESLFATVDVGDAIIANAHLRVATPAGAAQIVANAHGTLGPARMFVERLDIAAVDRDVVVDVAVTEAQVTQILGLLNVAMP